MTSDPRALQYLFQTSGYNAIKSPFILERSKLLWGENILSTEGNVHKRHRRAVLPAFALPETKALTHVFQEKAEKVRRHSGT
jgi:cytochrome P450